MLHANFHSHKTLLLLLHANFRSHKILLLLSIRYLPVQYSQKQLIQIKNITVHTITKKRNRIGIPLSFLQVTTGNKRQHFFTKDEFLSRTIDGFSRIGNHSVSASHWTSRLYLQERPRSRIYKGYWYMLSHSAISSSGGRPLDGRCYRRM